LYFNLAILYAKVKKIDEAVSAIKKAIEIDPKYVDAYMVLGLLCEVKHKFAEARDAYETALKTDPGNLRAGQSLARVYFILHDKKKAIAEFEKLIEEYIPKKKKITCLCLLYILKRKTWIKP
jgi:tetratricopeptide (TPR) repeat protein